MTSARIPAAVAAVSLGLGAAAALMPNTAEAAPAYFTARTTATVNDRQAPTANSASYGVYKKGAAVTIGCKVLGQYVGGVAEWYWTPGEGPGGFVSAKYVAIDSRKVPECHGTKAVTTTTKVAANIRRGPSLKDDVVGTVRKGTTVTLLCAEQVSNGTSVTTWAYTSARRWVAASTLNGTVNADTRPGACYR